mmetsp:Transcript_2617/g.4381  ORF Transcript_2617/g.4381 Transcript_2617/m.4381 type:complete len:116 (+) Transcript_2617:29-376(+)
MKAKAEGPLFSNVGKSKDHDDEIRLAPKKANNTSTIAPKSDDYDFDKATNAKKAPTQNPKIEEVKQEKPTQQQQQDKKKKSSGFGGFSAGFLNARPQKKLQQNENKSIQANQSSR